MQWWVQIYTGAEDRDDSRASQEAVEKRLDLMH